MNPLSAIYAGGVGLRNRLYDRGVFAVRKLWAPVISVGSISAGGAGKTPFVIFLAEFLKRQGIRFDVLSRGYGRRSRGVRLVDPNGPPAEFGDEPLLIARRLDCPVIVGESRYQAGLLAEKQFSAEVHLLDDGFQHRSLARDLDIVLLTPEDLEDSLLPAGRLREQLGAVRRAQVIALMGDLNVRQVYLEGRSRWRLRRGVSLRQNPTNAVVFCGIARPQRFFEELRAAGVQTAAQRTFPDHHAYSADDVKSLLRLAREKNAGGFVTTEKDAINLGLRMHELGEIAVAQVTLQIEPADALDTVFRVIANREPQREKIRNQ